MNFSRILILVVSNMLMGCASYAQPDPVIATSALINKIAENIKSIDQLGYSAQERFKDMSSDSFEVRNFQINYRYNVKNDLYGYDWKVEETCQQGVLTIMFLPEGLFIMLNDSLDKQMIQRNLPYQLDPGSYHEYLRSSFLLDEVLSPFITVPPEDISIRDSNSYVILFRKTTDHSTRKVILDKATHWPTEAINIYYDHDLDLQQVQQIYFSEYKRNFIPSDSIFSPEYYKARGYSYKLLPEEIEKEEEINPIDVTKSKVTLLTYPFLTETDDTLFLRQPDSGYLLLDFWYASCEPCLKALPSINTLLDAYPASKLRVVGINGFDLKHKAFVSSKLRAKGIKIELLYGERKLIEDLNLNAFPAYMLLTPDGKLQYLSGGIEGVMETIHELLK